MVTVENLTSKLEDKLNEILGQSVKQIKLFLDGGDYTKPYVDLNEVHDDYVQGVSMLNSSSIVPINGILVQTFNVGTEIAVPIDTDIIANVKEDGSIEMDSQEYADSIEPYRLAIEKLASQTYLETVEADGKNYAVSYTVSQPRTGRIYQRDGLGFSISFSFVVDYAIIQNGINSQDIEIEFNGERVPFTQLSIVRSPVMDAGAFSNTNGTAKNYLSVSALQISLSVPALTNNTLTQEHFYFLLTGIPVIFDVSIAIKGYNGNNPQTYKMMFGDCNIAAKELDNVGQSITLVEALELT